MKDLKTRLSLEDMLRNAPHSYSELAQGLGISYEAVARYVKKLRDAKLAHVHDWAGAKDGRAMVAVIAWGKGVDAERPVADTAAQRMARTRANRRATC